MVNSELPGIAVCGLICSECDIFRAPDQPDLAKRIADDLTVRIGRPVTLDQIRCSGCHGPAAQCWSEDCEIRRCCVDERGFSTCGDCGDFPCERLLTWSRGNGRYAAALDRLLAMRA